MPWADSRPGRPPLILPSNPKACLISRTSPFAGGLAPPPDRAGRVLSRSVHGSGRARGGPIGSLDTCLGRARNVRPPPAGPEIGRTRRLMVNWTNGGRPSFFFFFFSRAQRSEISAKGRGGRVGSRRQLGPGRPAARKPWGPAPPKAEGRLFFGRARGPLAGKGWKNKAAFAQLKTSVRPPRSRLGLSPFGPKGPKAQSGKN